MRTLVFRAGWHLVFIGAGFVAVGLGLCATAVWFACLMPAENVPWWIKAAILAMASLPAGAAVLGGMLFCGGNRVTIDRVSGLVTIAHGVLVPWSRRNRSLADFHAVALTHEIVSASAGGDHNATSHYPVRLLAADEEIELVSPGDWRRGRARAESVAASLDLPLRDTSDGEEVERPPDALNVSLRERLIRSGQEVAWPNVPRSSRLRCMHRGDETVIEAPRIALRQVWRELIGVGILLALWTAMSIPGFYFMRSLAGSDDAPWVPLARIALAAFPMVAVIYLGLGVVILLGTRERIIVSPRGVSRLWRFPVGRWTRRLASAVIEEVRTDGEDVIVVTDRTRLRLGIMLSSADRRWLQKAVVSGLCR